MTGDEMRALYLLRLKILLFAVPACFVGGVLWSVVIEVGVLPEWFSYLGGPIVGLGVAWWLIARFGQRS